MWFIQNAYTEMFASIEGKSDKYCKKNNNIYLMYNITVILHYLKLGLGPLISDAISCADNLGHSKKHQRCYASVYRLILR